MGASKSTWRSLLVLVIVVAAIVAPATAAFALDNGVRQDGGGKYAQLTAQWWQWILEQPAAGNPNLDETGADAGSGQPARDVFFLAGTFGGPADRAFTVPADTALFFPLVNNAGIAPQPAPQPKAGQNQVPQLRVLLAAPFIDAVTELHVTLDGVSLLDTAARVKSPVFKFTVPANGLLDPGAYTGVSDGYWVYLAPLSPGTHILNFGGTSDGFAVDITDTITVE
jgi:hypothetical protein